ncbi:MAG: stage V sporulation protein S [Anaerolineae bacterium]
MNEQANLLKVASNSPSTAVAGAIAGMVREGKEPIVQAIGAGAVNQAIKAVVIARTYLAEDGIDIACVPSFVEVEIEGQERTAVRLEVNRRQPD